MIQRSFAAVLRALLRALPRLGRRHHVVLTALASVAFVAPSTAMADQVPPPDVTVTANGPTEVDMPNTVSLDIVPTPITTEYPYQEQLLDLDTGNVAYSCFVNTVCHVEPFANDLSVREPVVRHYQAIVVDGNTTVRLGNTITVTFNPVPLEPHVKVVGVDASGNGGFSVQASNKPLTQGPFLTVLKVKIPDSQGGGWSPFGTCPLSDRCVLQPSLITQDTKIRADSTDLTGQIIYASSPILTVTTAGGVDLRQLAALMELKNVDPCEELDTNGSIGTHAAESSASDQAIACHEVDGLSKLAKLKRIAATAGGAAVIAYLLVDAAAGPPGPRPHPNPNPTPQPPLPDPAPPYPEPYDEMIESIAQKLVSYNQPDLELVRARKVARACVPRLSDAGISPGRCAEPGLPILITGLDAKAAADHDRDALNPQKGGHPSWVLLNYETNDGKKNRQWYTRKKNDPTGICGEGKTGGDTGNDCDEYPFFTTEQGGVLANPLPSIAPVPLGQNRRQGAVYQNQIVDRCAMRTGAQSPIGSGPTATSNSRGGDLFLAIPSDLNPFSFGLCNGKR